MRRYYYDIINQYNILLLIDFHFHFRLVSYINDVPTLRKPECWPYRLHSWCIPIYIYIYTMDRSLFLPIELPSGVIAIYVITQSMSRIKFAHRNGDDEHFVLNLILNRIENIIIIYIIYTNAHLADSQEIQ